MTDLADAEASRLLASLVSIAKVHSAYVHMLHRWNLGSAERAFAEAEVARTLAEMQQLNERIQTIATQPEAPATAQ
jgi:hypothetical protein